MQIGNDFYTKRMTIRNCRKTDLPYLTPMWFDEENGRYLSDPAKEYVDEKFQKALDGIEDNPHGYFLTITLSNTAIIIGSSFLFPDDDKAGSFELAYCISKDYWRQGYATELLHSIIDWVRSHGGTELTAEAAKENVASHGLLIKMGFEVVGQSNFKKYNMDISFDSYVYRLILTNPEKL